MDGAAGSRRKKQICLGLIVALALLIGMVCMLFKPYKEATKRSDKTAVKV